VQLGGRCGWCPANSAASAGGGAGVANGRAPRSLEAGRCDAGAKQASKAVRTASTALLQRGRLRSSQPRCRAVASGRGPPPRRLRAAARLPGLRLVDAQGGRPISSACPAGPQMAAVFAGRGSAISDKVGETALCGRFPALQAGLQLAKWRQKDQTVSATSLCSGHEREDYLRKYSRQEG